MSESTANGSTASEYLSSEEADAALSAAKSYADAKASATEETLRAETDAKVSAVEANIPYAQVEANRQNIATLGTSVSKAQTSADAAQTDATAAKNAAASVNTALTNEMVARQNADAALAARVTGVETRVTAAEGVASQAFTEAEAAEDAATAASSKASTAAEAATNAQTAASVARQQAEAAEAAAEGKQDKLVSGTNIRTINGKSLLGSGDIVIQGGGGGGTSDYDDLENKPQIEGVTLEGNMTAADLAPAFTTDNAQLVATIKATVPILTQSSSDPEVYELGFVVGSTAIENLDPETSSVADVINALQGNN